MELAVRSEMRTYAGGLGILAGDTVRSCADLALPVVFVTLASHAGYFRQRIDGKGRQVEEPDAWQPAEWCTPLEAMIAVSELSRGQRLPTDVVLTVRSRDDDRSWTSELEDRAFERREPWWV